MTCQKVISGALWKTFVADECKICNEVASWMQLYWMDVLNLPSLMFSSG